MTSTLHTKQNTLNTLRNIGAVGSGTSGQFLTSGSNGTSYNWSAPTDNVMVVKQNPPQLEIKGTVVINGLDLEERLKTIEKVLAIPERDATMEAKYPSLKKKFDEYINTLEKYRTFERIKGDDNGIT